MARNEEVIRQWDILRTIDASRAGVTIKTLAEHCGVSERTIRRDLFALCRAGFPLTDEKVNGTSMWKLRAKPFSRLEQGLGVTELCSLYFSRTLLDTLAGSPLQEDAARAMAKIERALPASCRHFIDDLPRTLQAKRGRRKVHDPRHLREVITRALDATLLHRRVAMRYASASSRETKEYVIEPQRFVYADGGIYIIAWVPAYGQFRTFAAERVETLAHTGESFEPRALPSEPFADSLGVYTGKPEKIVIEFEPDAAPFVREREWHASQVIKDRDDGGIVLTLTVCNDQPLRSWILGFGPSARVIAPVDLQRDIFEAVDRTRIRYLRADRAAHFEMVTMKAG